MNQKILNFIYKKIKNYPFVSFSAILVFIAFIACSFEEINDDVFGISPIKFSFYLNKKKLEIFETIFIVFTAFFSIFIWHNDRIEARKMDINLLIDELCGNIKLLGPFTKRPAGLTESNNWIGVQELVLKNSIVCILNKYYHLKKFPIPEDRGFDEYRSDSLGIKEVYAEYDFFRSNFFITNRCADEFWRSHKHNLNPLVHLNIEKFISNSSSFGYIYDRKIFQSLSDLNHSIKRYNQLYYFFNEIRIDKGVFDEDIDPSMRPVLEKIIDTAWDWVFWRLYYTLYYINNDAKYKFLIEKNADLESLI